MDTRGVRIATQHRLLSFRRPSPKMDRWLEVSKLQGAVAQNNGGTTAAQNHVAYLENPSNDLWPVVNDDHNDVETSVTPYKVSATFV
ncbi:jg9162 [Pararge aegeria aegeria]|uniref:Jg9162 protein n=1 Tax=Pararge aegeria aegeria TaxID=348720 RepID=A0A8S4S2G9_9NEOP|nr:jg9162 [Pararge aegeria aegeria]